MNRITAWLKSWWAFSRVSRQLSALDRKVEESESMKASAKKKLEWWEKRFELWEGKFDSREARFRSELTNAKTDLKNAMKAQEISDEQIQRLRAEIDIKDEQISMLVACNRAVLERVNRIAAEEIRKRIGATLPREDLEDYGRV